MVNKILGATLRLKTLYLGKEVTVGLELEHIKKIYPDFDLQMDKYLTSVYKLRLKELKEEQKKLKELVKHK